MNFSAIDPDSGQMERVLSIESLAAAHEAGKALIWARLLEVGGEEAVAEFCEELDLDPEEIIYPKDIPQNESSSSNQPDECGSENRTTISGALTQSESELELQIGDVTRNGNRSQSDVDPATQSEQSGGGSGGWMQGWKWPWEKQRELGGQAGSSRLVAGAEANGLSAEVERQENAERAR